MSPDRHKYTDSEIHEIEWTSQWSQQYGKSWHIHSPNAIQFCCKWKDVKDSKMRAGMNGMLHDASPAPGFDGVTLLGHWVLMVSPCCTQIMVKNTSMKSKNGINCMNLVWVLNLGNAIAQAVYLHTLYSQYREISKYSV